MNNIRTKTKVIKIGNLQIGGQNNVVIQSMTNTKTSDINKTLEQIKRLKNAGCELVRLAIFDDEDINALPAILEKSLLPIVTDIHFNFEYAIKSIEMGVKKIRLNPGNLDDPKKLKIICELANKHNVVIRVGVNSGSLPRWALDKYGYSAQAMIETAKHYVNLLNSYDFNNIVISIKASDPLLMIDAYELASQNFDYPLHLGVPEAGTLLDGTIKSVAGLTPLLVKGIGDTIRISLTEDPVKEIEVARKLLNTLKIRNDLVDIISCPTCGRLNFDMMLLVEKVKEYTKQMFFPLKISILGCFVNGIGEGKEADIGVAGSLKQAVIFKNGKILKTVKEDEVFNELKILIDEAYQNWLDKNG